MSEDETAAALNTTVPHSARIWNYWLGGTDNFAVDRELGEHLRRVYPAIADLARSDRQFLNRAVRYLAGQAGIRQFLDIGSGLPTVERVTAATVPGSYLVIAHGSSTSEGLSEAARQYREGGAETYHLRGPEQLARFFAPLDLVPPGVVPVPQWRPDPGADPGPAEAYSYCAIGRVN